MFKMTEPQTNSSKTWIKALQLSLDEGMKKSYVSNNTLWWIIIQNLQNLD